MSEVLRVFLCLCLCVNIVLCQFGFFPRREDRFQGRRFGHIRNPKRIRDRLSGILHFYPENENSNPAYIYPFNERPEITSNRPNYEQNGRPTFSYENNQNYVNPYDGYNGVNSGNPIAFPTSGSQEYNGNQDPNQSNQLTNVNEYQPNQFPQTTQGGQQLNSNPNKQDSNVIFQPIPNQGSNIFIYPNQENPSNYESSQQSGKNSESNNQPTQNPPINGYQPTQSDNTESTKNQPTQVNFETNAETTQAFYNQPTQGSTPPTQVNSETGYQPNNNNQDIAVTVKTTELPKDEGLQSINSGAINFDGDSFSLSGSSTLPPLTPVPASQTGNNFNFGARGIFSETCETIDNEIGSCISVYECPPYLKIIQDYNSNPASVQLLRRVHCGFDGNNPKVCCPRQGIPTIPPTEPTFPTTTTTTTAAPVLEPEGKNINSEDFISVMPEPPICGLSNASFSRVVGGVDAKIGDFPWMALLGYKGRRNPGVRWLCGGSLISSKHVLTAAHCIHGHEEDLYLVRLGELDLARDDEGATPVDVLIKKKVKHEEYDANAFTNDIGILVLDRDVGFTNLIKPICIPKETELRARSFENYNPIIAGWGDTEFRGPSATLLQALQLPVVSNEFCSQAYAKYKPQKIDERVLCAGYKKGGRDACQGDSGGPLMQPIWNSEVFTTYFYQIGVVSYGKKCAEAGFPGVYSRVTHFVPWIESKITGAG